MPRTTKDAVDKPIPQLRKRPLDLLAQTAHQCASLPRLLRGNHQQLGFLSQQVRQGCAAVAAITEQMPPSTA